MNTSSANKDFEQLSPYRAPRATDRHDAGVTQIRPASKLAWTTVCIAIGLMVVGFYFVATFTANRHRVMDADQQQAKTESKETELRQFVEQYGSFHRGGAHVLMDDGSVKFKQPTYVIDRQQELNPQDGKSSPYGLWGDLGTRANAEPDAS